MLSGTRDEPLRVAGIEVADAICFDVAYDDGIYDQVASGAELLAVQTSNAIFIFTDQIDQQFAITRLRAIETGRYARGRRHQRHLRRDRARRHAWSPRPSRAPRPCCVEDGRAAAPASRRRCGSGRGSAVLLPLLTAVGLVLRRGHVSSRAATAPDRRRETVRTVHRREASRD